MCPLSEDTQPVKPVPVSLVGAGLAHAGPASQSLAETKPFKTKPANYRSEDTQPVNTQPPGIAAAEHKRPSDGELGRLVFAYRPVPDSRAFKIAWESAGALLSLSLLGYGAYLIGTTYQRFGPVPALSRSAPWFALGGAVMLTWLAVSIWRWSRVQPGVRLHANGLYIEGRRNQSLLWEQIDGIAHGVLSPGGLWSRNMHYQARLFPSKGRPVYLYAAGNGKRGLPYLPELVSRIKASLYPALQVELARMFREGLPLIFGPVRIDREGLKIRRRLLPGTISVPWGHVKRITVQSGYFLVESSHRHSPYRLPVSIIPNLEILLKIIDQGVHP